MLNVIKSDLFRIFKSKSLYVILVVIALLMIVSIVSMTPVTMMFTTTNTDITNINIDDVELVQKINSANNIGDIRAIMKEGGAYPLDRYIIANSINLYYAFIVVVGIVVIEDFSKKSIKNTLSSAITRKQYYLSKLILVAVLCIFLILFHNILAYVLNFYINGKEFSTSFLEIVKITFKQLPLLYGMISLLMCFAFTIRNKSLFNSVSIPFVIVVQLVGSLVIELFRIKDEWLNYEIQGALAKITNNFDGAYIRNCIILGLVYIVIFNVIGYFSFKKAEIK